MPDERRERAAARALQPKTIDDLESRYGAWTDHDQDGADLADPPVWARGDDVNLRHRSGVETKGASTGDVWVTPAVVDEDDTDAYDVAVCDALARWTRVVQPVDDGALSVLIVGDDAAEVDPSGISFVRRPAEIRVGGVFTLTPLAAMRLAEALGQAVQLVTDDEAYASTYLAARGVEQARARAAAEDAAVWTNTAPTVTDQPAAPLTAADLLDARAAGCPCMPDEGGQSVIVAAGCPVHGTSTT